MERIAIIGYGEAGRAFVGGGLGASAAYDCDPAKRNGIAAHDRPKDALHGATLVLSLVTADRVLGAAKTYAPLIAPGTLWCDLNSVAPDTKRAAAAALAAVGVAYLDVAIMAPVDPAQTAVPLLVSGPDADAGVERLKAAGFTNVRAVGDTVGRASSIKMIRSVMVKGIEALTAEMMLAGDAAGVTDEVLVSLGGDWPAKAAYNLERMKIHGLRRAAEMEESAKTLSALGVDPIMTRGTVIKQREMAA
jgi:3-hydroxyisobutyrate dehydrogenase-like beta-hydroxyacid dehydrogenase